MIEHDNAVTEVEGEKSTTSLGRGRGEVDGSARGRGAPKKHEYPTIRTDAHTAVVRKNNTGIGRHGTEWEAFLPSW